VCCSWLRLGVARAGLADGACGVRLLSVTREDVPSSLRTAFDSTMAEGVAWKLAPLRVFPDLWEISLDNDCILWDLPDGMRRWLHSADQRQCLLAEDARALYGQLTLFCGPEPRNQGIRGLLPHLPLEQALPQLVRHV